MVTSLPTIFYSYMTIDYVWQKIYKFKAIKLTGIQ